jgi:hypothetical protein
MPTYILLSSLTPEGSQTLHKDPGYRVRRRLSGNRSRRANRCPCLCGPVIARHGQDPNATWDSGCPAQS